MYNGRLGGGGEKLGTSASDEALTTAIILPTHTRKEHDDAIFPVGAQLHQAAQALKGTLCFSETDSKYDPPSQD